MKLEQALDRLTEIVETAENGDCTLEEMLALYKEGLKLSKICETALGKYEREIVILQKDAAGLFTEQPFEEGGLQHGN